MNIHNLDILATLQAAAILTGTWRVMSDKPLGGFLGVTTCTAPILFMLSHNPPTMDTVLWQWGLAFAILGGSMTTGVICLACAVVHAAERIIPAIGDRIQAVRIALTPSLRAERDAFFATENARDGVRR